MLDGVGKGLLLVIVLDVVQGDGGTAGNRVTHVCGNHLVKLVAGIGLLIQGAILNLDGVRSVDPDLLGIGFGELFHTVHHMFDGVGKGLGLGQVLDVVEGDIIIIAAYHDRVGANDLITLNICGRFKLGLVIVERAGLGLVQHLVGTLFQILDRVVVLGGGIVVGDLQRTSGCYLIVSRGNLNTGVPIESLGVSRSKLCADIKGKPLGSLCQRLTVCFFKVMESGHTERGNVNFSIQMPAEFVLSHMVGGIVIGTP